jgi:hypothetical protein
MGNVEDLLTMDEIEGAAAELAGKVNSLRGTNLRRGDVLDLIHSQLSARGAGHSVTELCGELADMAGVVRAEEEMHGQAFGLSAGDAFGMASSDDLFAPSNHGEAARLATDREVNRLVALGAYRPGMRPANHATGNMASSYPVLQPDREGEPSEPAESVVARAQLDGPPSLKAMFTRPDGTDANMRRR